MNRRSSLKKLTALSALGLSGIEILAHAPQGAGARLDNVGPRPLYFFTKALQWLPLADVPQVTKDLGFTGVDLPVRSNGFFDIDEMKSKLPAVMRDCANLGLETPVLTTEMTLAKRSEWEEFIKILSGEGIKNYRMGWMPFPSKNIVSELKSLNSQMKQVAELHAHHGVCGHYQNHAGSRIGGSVWEIYHLLDGINPDHIGIQFDLRHATVEGYQSYENVFHLVSDQIRSFDLKDFVWGKNPKGKGDVPVNVLFGEGNVNFRLLLDHPRFSDPNMPKIVHAEYDLGGAEHGRKDPSMEPKQILATIAKDVVAYDELMTT
ncbi:MAG: TIM barrel protein [Lunatimonas sp.]|nr:TIM barrel protein [Lunatimonas sp.]